MHLCLLFCYCLRICEIEEVGKKTNSFFGIDKELFSEMRKTFLKVLIEDFIKKDFKHLRFFYILQYIARLAVERLANGFQRTKAYCFCFAGF